MFSFPAMPYAQVPPPVMTAVTQGISSDTTLGSIPARAVYSAIAVPELQNQRGGGAPYTALSSAAIPSAASTGNIALQLAQLGTAGGSPDFSVAFFAQLLAQSESETQTQITQLFRDAVPLKPGNPELFEAYAEIKYLPSRAAVPAAPEKAPAPPVATAMPNSSRQPMVTMQHAFSYAPFGKSQILYEPPPSVPRPPQNQRILGSKTPAESYLLTHQRKVTAAESEMDAAA
jgi:hypothetical protein